MIGSENMEKNIKRWLDNNFTANLENKTVVITGANSGIGYYVAYLCAYYKANVIMAIRNLKRGEDAKNKILNELPEAKISLMQLDLANIESILSFTNQIKNEQIDIDVFYNNAGILKETSKFTVDGYGQVMGTNYLGTYILNENLKDYFKSLNHEVRVIFTTSISQYKHELNYDDLFLVNGEYKTFKKYSNSKRATTHYFMYLKEEVENSNVKALLVHPGVTYTPIVGKSFGKVISFLADKFMNLIFHKVSKASLSTMYLLNEDIPNGTFAGPRGIKMIAGYPKTHKLTKKVTKDYQKTIETTKKLGF